MGHFAACIKGSPTLGRAGREPMTTTTTTTTTTKNKNKKIRTFPHEDLESATSGFSPAALLGRGSHGSVFLASLDGGRLLAAAKVPYDSPDHPTAAPDAEIALLSSIPRSPLLVNLLGATPASGPRPRIAVVDHMPLGSLDDRLHDPLRPPPPWPRRLRLAARVAAALAYLHALRPPVAHRDIKPSNVLLDSRGRARLADFGLALRLGPQPTAAAPAGTIGYLDPAYLFPSDLSTKTDVYSFGVVLLEVISGRKAIDVDHSPPCLVDWARPLLTEGRFGELWDPRAPPAAGKEDATAREAAAIAGRCVGTVAEERPAMAEVAAALRKAGKRAGSSSSTSTSTSTSPALESSPPAAARRWRRLAWCARVGTKNSPKSGRVSDMAS